MIRKSFMLFRKNLLINSSSHSIIVSSPVHRGSDTTNTFLASPSVNPISPAISSMSSNSAKPLNTQLTSTSLTVAPPRVSHGSITFADDVGKSLTETKGNTKNIADKLCGFYKSSISSLMMYNEANYI